MKANISSLENFRFLLVLFALIVVFLYGLTGMAFIAVGGMIGIAGNNSRKFSINLIQIILPLILVTVYLYLEIGFEGFKRMLNFPSNVVIVLVMVSLAIEIFIQWQKNNNLVQ